MSRRTLLRQAMTAGAIALRPGAVAGLLTGVFGMTACNDPVDPLERVKIDLRNDPGVLNYLYAIVQLEQDFYARVAQFRFPGMLAVERTAINTFQSQTQSAANEFENTHHDGRITDYLLFRFGEHVDFSDRTSVMTTAQTIADASARGTSAAIGYASASATVTKATELANAALARANAIRAFNSAPSLTITPVSPVDVMAELAPYYRTAVTVVVA